MRRCVTANLNIKLIFSINATHLILKTYVLSNASEFLFKLIIKQKKYYQRHFAFKYLFYEYSAYPYLFSIVY
jgi:hypothetical protein